MALGDQIYVMREVAGIPGIYEHHGIDCGDGSVIHYSKAGDVPTVTRTPKAVFARGQPVFVKSQSPAFLPLIVVQRAERRLGEQAYDLLKNNCEHFASWCKTGRPESEQLAGFGLHMDRWRSSDLHKLVATTARDRSPDEAIALFHQALQDIAAAHHSLKRRHETARHTRDTWQRVAQVALKRDREDLARAALYRKRTAQKKIEDLTRQLADLVELQLTVEGQRSWAISRRQGSPSEYR